MLNKRVKLTNRNILKYIFKKEKENNTPPEVGEQSTQYKKERKDGRGRKKSLKAMEGKIDINRTG